MLFLLNRNKILLNTMNKRSLIYKNVFKQSAFFTSNNNIIIEKEIYEKKEPIEHVLLRPHMYVGPIEEDVSNIWVYNNKIKGMIKKDIKYTPAFIKIFDEIITNAADNKLRDPNMSYIHVNINRGSKKNKILPIISIENDGKGLPIRLHQTENILIPELIFGYLMTGSNFNDSEARLTGGRHGFGAKLTNIFSNKFQVETKDISNNKYFSLIWENNMNNKTEQHLIDLNDLTLDKLSKISLSSIYDKTYNNNKDFTRITFQPDLNRFKMNEYYINDENYKMLEKRIYDIAACVSPGVQVYLNNELININSFEDYMKLFIENINDEHHLPLFHTKMNDRWEIGLMISTTQQFEQMSFVNSISTLRGGTHVNMVLNQLINKIIKYVSKKHNDLKITPNDIKQHLFLYVNSLIENPSFDSQMKDFLSTKPENFGSKCQITDKFIDNIIKKSDLIDRIVELALIKQKSSLFKRPTSQRGLNKLILGIPKLEDAHYAGVNEKNMDCTLILTEGDSAKALAIAGLEKVGRGYYGVFPLRGKFLNVRDATMKQLLNNQEFQHMCTILGLDIDEKYDTLESIQKLRYGKIMIMTDQDDDGSHIKGLLINLFHHFWPSLLKNEHFLFTFITPLIKVTAPRGVWVNNENNDNNNNNNNEKLKQLSFFSKQDFEKWKNKRRLEYNDIDKWKIKYYKGLGTSTANEGREYFNNLDLYKKRFYWESSIDGDLIDLAFRRNRASERRDWLLKYDENIYPDFKLNHISYNEFINKELIQFSNADNIRSIPSVFDGLKTSQRKVLYACFKRKLEKNEIKVAQLAGYCGEHTAYHHGEASLHSTIINMAQNFVGSNNIPLILPNGQFGTRMQGGKDAASPRYIFTTLNQLTRLIYPEIDDRLLEYCEDDGQIVEPKYYLPILPMLLINGSQGIGTGWSTYIPQYNPLDIINYLKNKLKYIKNNNNIDNFIKNQSKKQLLPWYKNFNGNIKFFNKLKNNDDNENNKRELYYKKFKNIKTIGNIKKKNSTTLIIDELPVSKWTVDYKEILLKKIEEGLIKDFREYHTNENVKFEISLTRRAMKDLELIDIIKAFNLESSLPLSNMHAFSYNGLIKKYDYPEDMIDDYYDLRYNAYEKRKLMLEKDISYEKKVLENKFRFMNDIANKKLDILNGKLSKNDLIELLKELNYESHDTLKKMILYPKKELDQKKENQDDYNYLLSIPIYNFTSEKINDITKNIDSLEEREKELLNLTPADLWLNDLKELENKLKKDKEMKK